MTTVQELNAERARLMRRLRQLQRLKDADDDAFDGDEEIRLWREVRALEAQIEELGGTVDPVPPDGVVNAGGEASPAASPDPDPDAGPSSGATTHLGSPPRGIDQEWNDLVDAYEKAQQDAADHAMAERDDWTCTHEDPRVHGGCAIWWRGEMDNLLAHLRDAADRLIDHLAGPRTEEEFRNDQERVNLRRRDLEPLEAQIRELERRLDELLAQFEEDEKVYKALRDAGGDIGPYTGVVSAGRHRLLADIAALQQQLTELRGRRTALLRRLLELRKEAGQVRPERGLGEAARRWPDLFLDLDSLTDEELLRRLLGDEQFESMDATRHKQGTQMRRNQTRRTSFRDRAALLALVAVVLLLGAVGVVLVWGGDGEEAASDATAAEGELVGEAGDPAVPSTTEPVDRADECVLTSALELIGVEVVPGSHHQGNVAVTVTDAAGEPVDGADVAISTDKSDGTTTEALGTTTDGLVVFGMVTTAHGPNTIVIEGVSLPDCSWSSDSATSLTWDAVP